MNNKRIEKLYKMAYINGNPNLADYIYNAIPVNESSGIDTAATDGEEIFYNEKFLDTIKSDKEVLGIFAHEYYHIIYNHVIRRGNRNPLLWNLAADVVVNESVESRLGFKIPDIFIKRGKGIFKDLPADLKTTTKIYDWIIKTAKEMSKEESQYAQDHEDQQNKAKNESDKTDNKQDSNSRKKAGQASDKNNDEIKEVLGVSLDGLDWIDLVKAMQIEAGRLVVRTHKRGYRRPARYEPMGAILPYNKSYQHRPKIDVYIDVSGSMNENPKIIFSGLKTILSKLRIYRPKFFSFNESIREIDMNKNISIGGGTDIKKVIKKITDDHVDLAILITDCEDSIKREDIPKNVVVVSTNKQFADYFTNDWKMVKRGG